MIQLVNDLERMPVAIESYGPQGNPCQNPVNENSPVMVIEDDEDDQYILSVVFKKLNYINRIIYFCDGQQAFDYLKTTTDIPFLILSDIIMPRLDGFALRDKLKTDPDLQLRSIPYLFFSSTIDPKMAVNAYGLSAQGFFVKPSAIDKLERTISIIMDYWKESVALNNC